MSTLVRLLLILAALLLSASAAPALTYHETTDGDLPGPSFLGENPPILELDFGTNQVSGSQQIIVDFPSGIDEDDPDAFQIQLPAKGFLSNISVTFENESIGHPAAETFMDYRLLLAPPSFSPNVLTTSRAGDGDSGTIPLFQGELPSTLGALHEIYLDGFTASITGVGTFDYSYSMSLVVQLPEPSRLALLGLALGAVARGARRPVPEP